MRELLISSFNDFKRSYRQYLTFELLYFLVTGFLFVPLISYIFNRLFIIMGSSFYLNHDVFKIVLNYKGIIGIFFIAVLAVMFIFLEIGVLIIISHRKYLKRDIFISEAIITTIRKIPKIFGIGMLHLIIMFLLIIPFINIPVSPALISDVEIPAFIRDGIFVSPLLTSAYFICLIISIYLFIRWIFAVHLVMIEDKPVRAAIAGSVRLTRKNRIRILLKLVILNSLLLGAAFLISSGIALIPWFSELDFGYLLRNQLITVSGLLSFAFSLLLTPVNIIFLTRLYYKYAGAKEEKTKAEIRIYGNRILGRIESAVNSFLKKRRGLAYLIVGAYMAAAIPVSLMVSDSIINIGRPVLVAAHRGDPVNAPENTMSSIRAALEQGAEYVEIDVQMTRDGVIVLGHDATLLRTTGAHNRISDLTYEEISRLDAGSRFSLEFEGERMPTLSQVLDEVRDRARLIIEIKPYGPPAMIAQAVVLAVAQAGMTHVCYIQSFQYEILKEVRRLDPDIKIGQVMFFAVGDLDKLDVDFYSIEKGLLSSDFVKRARRQDRDIWVWTVNNDSDISRVLTYDIDGIITDYPARVLSVIGADF